MTTYLYLNYRNPSLMKHIAFFVCILVLASCTLTGNAVKEDKIKIGVLAPLTGPNPACGAEFKVGLETALHVLKEEGFNNIELVYEDTKFNPKEAVFAANKLINQKIKILIGACSSSSTLAVAPIAEENKVILFTPTSYAQSISEAGDYVFRMAITPNQDAPKIARFLKKLGKDRIAIVYLNNDYGRSYLEEFTKEFEKLGGKVVVSEAASVIETDFKTTLLKIRDARVDTVFMPYTSNPAIILVKQAHELGLNLIFFATNTVEREDFTNGVGELSYNKIYFTSLIDHASSPKNELKKFENAREALFPNLRAITLRVQSYDTLRVLAIAIKNCAENTDCIRDYLYSIKDYEGATGEFYIDSNGDAIHPDIYINVMTPEGFKKIS